MSKFTFSSYTETVEGNQAFKSFAAPSPSKDYSLTIKYYRNEQMCEGDYYTRDFSNIFPDVFLYIRKKDNERFAVFKYNGNIWIHRHKNDSVFYDDIMNLTEISTDIQNEWDSLVSVI